MCRRGVRGCVRGSGRSKRSVGSHHTGVWWDREGGKGGKRGCGGERVCRRGGERMCVRGGERVWWQHHTGVWWD